MRLIPFRLCPGLSRRCGQTLLALLLGTSAVKPCLAQGSLFGVTQGSDPTLVRVNELTGATTTLGVSGAVGAQVSALTAASTAALYGGTTDGNLILISSTSGMSTLVGSTGSSDPLYGLTFFGGSLYGLQGVFRENLVRIDPSTGLETVLGVVQDSSGAGIGGRGLTVLGNMLITADAALGAGGDLFAINPVSGLATDLTSSGTGFRINGLKGLAESGGQLYAINNDTSDPSNPAGLYTIDPNTAASSLVGSTGTLGPRIGSLAALPPADVPEPGSLALCAATALGLLLPLRHRVRRF